jgi:hypothetical protein
MPSTKRAASTAGVLLLLTCSSLWGSEVLRPPNVVWVANEAATGTALNKLVKLTGAPSTGTVASAGDKIGVVGVCVSGCGTAAVSARASVANWGNVSCAFDGATTAGNYVGISATAAGSCTDTGLAYPRTGQVIGRVLSTNGGGGTYPIVLFSADVDAVASGVWSRTGNTAPGTLSAVVWGRNLVVGNPSTLGNEAITNGAFTAPGAEWSRTGDMALSGTAAVYTHATGVGTLNQPNASLAVKIADGKWYYMVYTVSGVTPGVTWTLPNTVCDTTGGLNCVVDLTAGVAKVFMFKSAATASTNAFLSNFTSTAGGVTIDDLSLKEVAGGDLMLSGNLFARGAALYGGSSPGNVILTVKGGIGQTANLQNWANSAGTNLVYIDSTGRIFSAGVTASASVNSTSVVASFGLYAGQGIIVGATSAGDTLLARTSTGRAQFNSGPINTLGKWAGLDVGSLYVNALATPGVTTVTPTCVPGVCNLTWSYTVEALAGDSTITIPGAVGSTALQNATINAASYNTVTWAAVTGATKYTVRRTVSAGVPATLGALATCTGITGLSCVDNGLVGDGGVAPAANTTGTTNSAKFATATVCASGASPSACGSAASGNVALPAGGTTLTVNTTSINAASQVQITENTTVGAALGVTCNATIVRTYSVTTITASTSFVITSSAAPAVNPACLSYSIRN